MEIERLPGYVLSVGENISNQLGLGEDIADRKKPQVVTVLPKNVIQVVAGGMHSACLTADGVVYTFGCNDEYALGRENTDGSAGKVELSEKIIQISAGDSHTATLAESGAVYAWGTFRVSEIDRMIEMKNLNKFSIFRTAVEFLAELLRKRLQKLHLNLI